MTAGKVNSQLDSQACSSSSLALPNASSSDSLFISRIRQVQPSTTIPMNQNYSLLGLRYFQQIQVLILNISINLFFDQREWMFALMAISRLSSLLPHSMCSVKVRWNKRDICTGICMDKDNKIFSGKIDWWVNKIYKNVNIYFFLAKIANGIGSSSSGCVLFARNSR
jgi:hypothetical protein